MQKAPQSVFISQHTRNEAIRAYENLIEDTLNDEIDSNALPAKLQVIGNELIEYIFKLNIKPEFRISLEIDHKGIGLYVDTAGDDFEKLSALFASEKSSDLSIKLNLIADEIQIRQAENSLHFVFESNSLYRELSNSRIQTLKKYFEPKQASKLKTHDSF